jgi:tetratricopeptide (TPR) repeat protein
LNPTLTTAEQKQARVHELRQTIGQRKPSYAEALELGELCLALDQIAHAEEYLQHAIELDLTAVRPRMLLCLLLLGFNRPVLNPHPDTDEIQKHLTWLCDHHPDLPEVRWLVHYFELDRLAQAGDWKTAIQRGNVAVSEFPDNYLLQFMYGMALIYFGDTKRLTRADYRLAIHHMRLAAELNPNYEPAAKNIKALEDLAAKARK